MSTLTTPPPQPPEAAPPPPVAAPDAAPATSEANTAFARVGLMALVDRVVEAIVRMPLGDQAKLRRIDVGRPHPECDAFWRLLSMVDNASFPMTEKRQRRWAWVFRTMAGTFTNHNPKASTASAMQQAVGEDRFVRLLHAENPETTEDLLGQAIRQIDQKALDFDWGILVDFYFSVDTDRREQVRRKMARGFYAAAAGAKLRPVPAPVAGAQAEGDGAPASNPSQDSKPSKARAKKAVEATTSASPEGESVAPEKRKRGRPKKNTTET